MGGVCAAFAPQVTRVSSQTISALLATSTFVFIFHQLLYADVSDADTFADRLFAAAGLGSNIVFVLAATLGMQFVAVAPFTSIPTTILTPFGAIPKRQDTVELVALFIASVAIAYAVWSSFKMAHRQLNVIGGIPPSSAAEILPRLTLRLPFLLRKVALFLKSWRGKHISIIANAVFSCCFVCFQIVGVRLTGSKEMVFVAIMQLGAIMVLTSGATLLCDARGSPFVLDRYFRVASMQKLGMLVLKLSFLALPVAVPVHAPHDLYYIWSCAAVDVLCPLWCVAGKVGACQYVDVDHERGQNMTSACVCLFKGEPTSWRRMLLVVQCIISQGVLMLLSMVDLRHMTSIPTIALTKHPRRLMAAYVVIVCAPNVILAMVTVSLTSPDQQCYMSIAEVMEVCLPCAPLVMLATEMKQIFSLFTPNAKPHGAVRTAGGYDLFRPLAVLLPSIGGAVLLHKAQNTNCPKIAIVHGALMVFGASAALVAPNLATGRWDPGEVRQELRVSVTVDEVSRTMEFTSLW